MEQNALFRKSAIDKLASPERLDVLMQVTSPQGWLALWTIALVLVAAIAWSIFGSLADRVAGQGMLVHGEGNRLIRASGSGTLSELLVTTDTEVFPEQVVARIAAATVDERINVAEGDRDRALRDFENFRSTALAQQTKNNLDISSRTVELDSLRRQLADEEARLPEREEALAAGRISRRDFDSFRNQLTTLQSRVNALDSQINQLRVDNRRLNSEIASRRLRVDQAEGSFDVTAATLESATTVTSSFRGRVVSLPKQVGDGVSAGDLIAAVEETEAPLQVALFVSEVEGSQVKVGMAVQIDLTPAVRKEEFGMLKGVVSDVGRIGATDDELLRVMASAAGAEEIRSAGPTLLVRIALDQDAATPTGLAWTSSSGPDTTLEGATRVSGSIIVDSRRPISLVVPILKGAFGG